MGLLVSGFGDIILPSQTRNSDAILPFEVELPAQAAEGNSRDSIGHDFIVKRPKHKPANCSSWSQRAACSQFAESLLLLTHQATSKLDAARDPEIVFGAVGGSHKSPGYSELSWRLCGRWGLLEARIKCASTYQSPFESSEYTCFC